LNTCSQNLVVADKITEPGALLGLVPGAVLRLVPGALLELAPGALLGLLSPSAVIYGDTQQI